MKKLLLALLLVIPGTGSTKDLSPWSIDRECTATSYIDWDAKNQGDVLLYYNIVTNTVNMGLHNRRFGFDKDFEGPVQVQMGAKFKVIAQAHGFAETQLLVLQIPFSKDMESNLIRAPFIKVSAAGEHFMTLQLKEVDQAVEMIYRCYGA